jgi:hypothetical protein
MIRNRAEIDLLGAFFLRSINERLESLRRERSNSDEAAAEIADYEDLKQRIEVFLDSATRFANKKATEKSAAKAATSFADGISNWWSRRHVEICDGVFDNTRKALDIALLGLGVNICLQAGAGGALAVAIPGVILGGKPVLEAIKAICNKSNGKDKDKAG